MMMDSQENPAGFDLDPEDFRRIADQFLEMAVEIVEDETRRPILPGINGANLDQLLAEPPPELGSDPIQVLGQFRETILKFRRRNGNQAFWAYVCSSADPIGILADLLASALNQIVTSWRSAPTATALERRVVSWLDEMVGFQGSGHGLLVSGGSAANTHGVACGVESQLRKAGRPYWHRNQLMVYASSEVHVSVRKAIRLLGIPKQNLRLIEIDDHRRLRCDRLEAFLTRDSEKGPLAGIVCSSAGTANSGTIDPLDQISDLCRRFGVWHHIDGSYGALAALTPDYAWLKRSFGQADSLALDPHKWLFSPLDCGCLLMRNPAASRATFSEHSEYTAVSQTDPVESFAFFDHGLEMSRRFRALKLWFQLKIRGVDAYRRVIGSNIRLRRQLDEMVSSQPHLEGIASDLSISCFRYWPPWLQDEKVVNQLNQRIFAEIAREGDYLISPTTLDGRFCLRVCIVNFRTTWREVEGFVARVVKLGKAISREET